MKTNVGTIDQFLRLVLVGLLALAILSGVIDGIMILIALFLGVLLVYTIIIRSCPVYTKAGWDTSE